MCSMAALDASACFSEEHNRQPSRFVVSARRHMSSEIGATENARHENAGPICKGGKCGKSYMESQSVKKCLKVVVFVCRVIPSV